MVAVGVLWGCTNPLMKSGSAGITTLKKSDNAVVQFIYEFIFLFTRWKVHRIITVLSSGLSRSILLIMISIITLCSTVRDTVLAQHERLSAVLHHIGQFGYVQLNQLQTVIRESSWKRTFTIEKHHISFDRITHHNTYHITSSSPSHCGLISTLASCHLFSDLSWSRHTTLTLVFRGDSGGSHSEQPYLHVHNFNQCAAERTGCHKMYDDDIMVYGAGGDGRCAESDSNVLVFFTSLVTQL